MPSQGGPETILPASFPVFSTQKSPFEVDVCPDHPGGVEVLVSLPVFSSMLPPCPSPTDSVLWYPFLCVYPGEKKKIKVIFARKE